MADFDYTDDSFVEEEEEKKSFSIDMLDVFSILLLVGAACLGAYFLLIFMNPYTALNPLPPNTPIPPVVIPSATITPLQLDDPWTETPTIQPSITPTSRATFTPIPTNTPLVLFTETFTPEPPTATATPQMPFEATVQKISSTVIHSDTACNWLGVGGTIEDSDKSPLWGVQVRLQGNLLGKTVDQLVISGISQAYGRSGFEFILGDAPIPSDGESLYIRLFDQAGLPLSDEVRFSTSASCEENLILIRFTKVR
ncbi:MAG: hypothetical protein HN390_11830 [Anaerolineae bacterium]|jgi:hypothetical protein|nr:hypothetical protein [Anaerolineae bacterium]MBT7072370.1 hypothetical protein [Anaerolineae bacterium]MBT7990884.1 hypothetical protein [Anaerolineae bacterium]